MFSVYCPGDGNVVLLTSDNIEVLANRADSIEVWWVCWCGQRGVEVFGTGRPAPSQVSGGAADDQPTMSRRP